MPAVIIYLLISLAIGALSCFFGKKFFFVMLAATVFFNVYKLVISKGGSGFGMVILAIAAGVIAAILAKFLYRTGVFLIGFVAGAGLGALLCGFLPETVLNYRWVVILAVALVIGVCAIKWCNLFMMLATAYSGATLLALPLSFLIMDITRLREFFTGANATVEHLNGYLHGAFSTDAKNATLILVFTIVLTVCGFFYQWKGAKRRR